MPYTTLKAKAIYPSPAYDLLAESGFLTWDYGNDFVYGHGGEKTDVTVANMQKQVGPGDLFYKGPEESFNYAVTVVLGCPNRHGHFTGNFCRECGGLA